MLNVVRPMSKILSTPATSAMKIFMAKGRGFFSVFLSDTCGRDDLSCRKEENISSGLDVDHEPADI